MSEDISAGVKILLERGKTNPDEIREIYGQWGELREAVFNYKERNERSAWLRGLTEHEIDLLFDMFNTVYRGVFDEWVMKTVLGAGESEEDAKMALHKRTQTYTYGWNDPKLFQNSIQPGAVVSIPTSITKQAEQLGLAHLLKKTLNKIKL